MRPGLRGDLQEVSTEWYTGAMRQVGDRKDDARRRPLLSLVLTYKD